jgi:hypothetical protein
LRVVVYILILYANVYVYAEVSLIAREQRLGLGATAKPPENNKARGAVAKKEEWTRKAEEKLQTQILHVGDIVWLRNVGCIGKRAKVEAVK